MTDTTKTTAGYTAAIETAAYYLHPNAGAMIVSGEDQIDFLQRQTTNDMGLLAEGRWIDNVLTTATARIIDMFQLIQQPEGIFAISILGKISASAKFLQGKIFFMDKVTVNEVSQEYAIIDLEGPAAGEMLTAFGQEGGKLVGSLERIIIEDKEILALTQKGLAAEIGYRLIIPTKRVSQVLKILNAAWATELEPDEYNVLRIEAGSPLHSNELNEDYTPLETNLIDAISDNKGCYTGQEVIARQLAYDKITKRLVQLQLDELVAPGAKVTVDGKKVGSITSAGYSASLGAIALAVLKRPHFAEGTELIVGDHVSGVVKKLER